jgi:hypothetical protein
MDGIPGIFQFRSRFGGQTVAYPEGPASFPERFRGLPLLDASKGDGGGAAAFARRPARARWPSRATTGWPPGRGMNWS